MKKAILSISKKQERITIRYKSKRKSKTAICEECGKQFDWLTVNEAAELIGKDSEDIQQNLKIIRSNNNDNKK